MSINISQGFTILEASYSSLNQVCLNTFTQGYKRGMRQGSQVKIKRLEINYYARTGGVTAYAQCGRFIVYIDRFPKGVFIDPNEILDNSLWLGQKNFDNSSRLIFLYDKLEVFEAESDTGSRHVHTFNIDFEPELVTTYFDFNTGTVSDIASNALQIYVASDSADHVDATIYFNVSFRVIYET